MVYTYTELRKIKIMPMDNCWMSPEGEVIYSDHHDCKAWDIIERRFGIHPSDVKEPSIFLGAKRWIAYHDRPWWTGWWIYYYSPGPTQAQIDKVYELTGEVYDEDSREFKKWEVIPCRLFFEKRLCVNYTSLASL